MWSTAYLDSSHPNFEEEYRVLIHKELFKNEDEAGFCKAINKLKQELTAGTFSKSIRIANSNDFEALCIAGHLYQPLLYLNESSFKHKEIGNLIEVRPVALNKGERDFVCDIQRFFDNNPAFLKINHCIYFATKVVKVLDSLMIVDSILILSYGLS